MHKLEHAADIFVIHSCKCLIQSNDSRMVFLLRFFILCIDCRKKRNIHRHSLFSAAETVKRRIGQKLPLPFPTSEKHVEFKPFAIIQRIPDKVHIIDHIAFIFQFLLFRADSASKMRRNLFNILYGQKRIISEQNLFKLCGI